MDADERFAVLSEGFLLLLWPAQHGVARKFHFYASRSTE